MFVEKILQHSNANVWPHPGLKSVVEMEINANTIQLYQNVAPSVLYNRGLLNVVEMEINVNTIQIYQDVKSVLQNRVECGGDGNICSHDPTLPECTDPCITQPWLVECGGTGDKCKYEPTLPECIITKKRHPLVWISLLGIAIIATYVIMKNKQDVEPEKEG